MNKNSDMSKVSADREVLEQVLEALEEIANAGAEDWGKRRPCVQEAYEQVDALSAVLASPEPGGVCARCGGWVYDPVLAQQAERKPLTDEAALDLLDDVLEGGSLLDVVRATERAHGIGD